MGRKQMIIWLIAAFALILTGINTAYEANSAMTGFSDVPQPVNYMQGDNYIKVIIMGKNYTLVYSEEEVKFYLEKTRQFVIEIVTYVNNFFHEIHYQGSKFLIISINVLFESPQK